MDIALVAPSPVPFVMGGAENLFLGLQRYLNEATSHHCELFKLPSPERDMGEVLQSYERFSRFRVDHFDRLISTKYPAWMVRHPQHVLYLQHTLRGLYDTYHFSQQALTPPTHHPRMAALWAWMGQVADQDEVLEPWFEQLRLLRQDAECAAWLDAFPGPWSRALVHFMDRQAMKGDRIARMAAISANVAGRADYFPPGRSVQVIHHPSGLQGLHCGADDYLFTASRLDGAKRVELLVRAMKWVKSDIALRIAGEGPDAARLRALADGDPRIQWLGRLNDAQLADAYADALAVPFVPYDEDYGLITIEAMQSGKPVITTRDAGGVLEFVTPGETGWVCEPDPQALALAMDEACQHRERTREMGRKARQRVAHIHWEHVVEGLIGPEAMAPRPTVFLPSDRPALPAQPHSGVSLTRPRWTVALTFAVWPPRGGGQSRVFHLYRHLAEQADITLVVLCGPDQPLRRQEIAPGLTQISVPRSAAHQGFENDWSRRVGWIPVTDIVAARAMHLTPDYLACLDEAVQGAQVLVASHPYLVSLLQDRRQKDQALWFEAHNVEWTLKKGLLSPCEGEEAAEAARQLLAWVHEDERQAWLGSSVVLACTDTDLQHLQTLYGPTSARQHVAPNGYSPEETQWTTPEFRAHVRHSLGVQGPVALFMGSWHGPNLEAVEEILQWSPKLPDVQFWILGSAARKFERHASPPGVCLLGEVDEREKQIFLSAADLALNPMWQGSGSNLKMFDYMAAGLPVISTSFGARGLLALPDEHYIPAERHEFVARITDVLMLQSAADRQALAQRAHAHVASHFSWSHIAAGVQAFLRQP